MKYSRGDARNTAIFIYDIFCLCTSQCWRVSLRAARAFASVDSAIRRLYGVGYRSIEIRQSVFVSLIVKSDNNSGRLKVTNIIESYPKVHIYP